MPIAEVPIAAVSIAPLPRSWRVTFVVELPLVLGTLAFWLAAPATYLRDTVGIAAPGAAEILLLRLYAGTVGSLVFGFYAWLLAQKAVHVATFRAFQASLGLGDVAIVLASLAAWSDSERHDMLGIQIGMATLWGIIRLVFLIRRPGHAAASVPANVG